MDDADAVRAQIPNFPGYATLADRRLADELVRSYLGEALSELAARHPDFFADAHDGYQRLIMRAGFMNQLAFHAFEYADGDAARQAAVAAGDRDLLTIADRSGAVDASGIPSYLDDVTAAFDRRDAAMEGK